MLENITVMVHLKGHAGTDSKAGLYAEETMEAWLLEGRVRYNVAHRILERRNFL